MQKSTFDQMASVIRGLKRRNVSLADPVEAHTVVAVLAELRLRMQERPKDEGMEVLIEFQDSVRVAVTVANSIAHVKPEEMRRAMSG